MIAADNTYSRLIGWLKILLPLVALAILSTLFLIARTIDPAQDLPYADVDVDELAREQRIGQPRYSSVTADGAAITLSARSALPDPENRGHITGTDVNADIELTGGMRVNIASGGLTIDNPAGLATLHGDVTVKTSDGYTMRTNAVEVRLDRTRISSASETRIDAPIGRLFADSFELSKPHDAASDYVLVFKGHVKLVYDPNE